MIGQSSTPPVGAPLSAWTAAPPIPPSGIASYLNEEIDPQTGETTSLTSGMDPTDATILTQFRTERGSGAAVLEDGHTLFKIESNDEDAPARIDFEIARLLRPFLARKEIVLPTPVQIAAGPEQGDTAAVEVVYTNVRTGEEQRLSFG